ncbi:MAG: PmoA family protein [Chitinophagaceae bacterium]
MKRTLIIFLSILSGLFATAQGGFSITEKKDGKGVDILFNGKLLTAYTYPDSSRKPVLFPVNTLDGVTVTRGYPFNMIAGERTDHPHHTGIWLNYESVNGLDFWNNSTAIALDKRDQYGTIVHQKIISQKSNYNHASLVTAANWIRPDKKVLLNEQTTFNFSVSGTSFIIDRVTTLTATDIEVVFKDVKDGMLAIRVARELEMPSKDKSSFVDDKGNVTTVAPSGSDVTGMYTNSDGVMGDSVWSTKSRWAILTGKKDHTFITIGMIDHPDNVGYPGYWHARGYGLFALNPLGREVFSKGAEKLNYSLQPHQSVTLKYRIVIHSGSYLNSGEMNHLADQFAGMK